MMSPQRHGFHFYNTLLFVYWLPTVWLKCSGLCLTERNQLSHTRPKTIEGRMRSTSRPTQGAVKPSHSSRPLNSFGWCAAWKSESQSPRRQWAPCSLPCPSLSERPTIVCECEEPSWASWYETQSWIWRGDCKTTIWWWVWFVTAWEEDFKL